MHIQLVEMCDGTTRIIYDVDPDAVPPAGAQRSTVFEHNSFVPIEFVHWERDGSVRIDRGYKLELAKRAKISELRQERQRIEDEGFDIWSGGHCFNVVRGDLPIILAVITQDKKLRRRAEPRRWTDEGGRRVELSPEELESLKDGYEAQDEKLYDAFNDAVDRIKRMNTVEDVERFRVDLDVTNRR